MLKSTSLFLCLFALSLGACSFKKSGAEDKSATPATVTQDDVNKQLKSEQEVAVANAQISADDVVVEFLETAEPNAYIMKVSWPGRVTHVSIQTKNKLADSSYSAPSYINFRNSYETDQDGGEEFQLLLTTFDAHNIPVATIIKNITIPHDIIISDSFILNKDKIISANRIYFNSNGSIDANGHDLTLTANQIIGTDQPSASGYQIISLSQNTINSNKKNGGTIVIHAKKAIGYIRIGLFGADGEEGKSGEEIAQRDNLQFTNPTQLNGANGISGTISDRHVHCKSLDGACAPIQFCSRQPTNGENGKPGQKGTDGEAGVAGGDTGSLSAIIQENDDFHLYVATKIGRGGRGGRGAPGHPGGKGGIAGSSDVYGICNKAQNGADGSQGPNGTDGINGADGKIGIIEHGSIKHYQEESITK